MRGMALVMVGTALIGLGGCAYSSPQQQEASACQVIGPKALVGGLVGAAGGAAIGAAAGGGKGAAIGAGVGLLTGAAVGYMADSQDCKAAQAALQSQLMAARAGTPIGWSSESGHTGQFMPQGDVYAGQNGAQCRRAASVTQAGGTPAQSFITCRHPDGTYTYAPG